MSCHLHENTTQVIKEDKSLCHFITIERRMEANKEQLVDNIMSNFVVIKDLLHEDNLGETDVHTLIELARLLEDTSKRLMEISSQEDEED